MMLIIKTYVQPVNRLKHDKIELFEFACVCNSLRHINRLGFELRYVVTRPVTGAVAE